MTFGVRLGAERMARLEILAQFAIVVDLAVQDDLHRAVLVADRLVPGVEVDDRKAPKAQAERALFV
jgi:hypothetical protein